MQNKDIRAFAASLIKEKGLQDIDQQIVDKMIDEISVRLDEQINRELFNSLNDNQVEELKHLIDTNNQEAASTFFQDKGVPVQDVITKTMINFKKAYLGPDVK